MEKLTPKETVKKAIHFETPGRIPKFFFNGDLSRSDIIQCVLEDWYLGPQKDETEWGFSWKRDLNDPASMGVPKTSPLEDWSYFEEFKKTLGPKPFDKFRFREVENADHKDKYFMGSLYLTGFTVMTMLRGFEQLMIDFYEDPEIVDQLAEYVFGIENDIIRQMPEYGFDAVALYDDYGMQTNVMISPEIFQRFIKPHLKNQVELAHSLGMDVFLHSCGDVKKILDDFVDVGIDMLNLGQADLNGWDNLKDNYRGKICFVHPINYQTTGITGTREEILAEGKMLRETFSMPQGGLISMLFDYEGMGWQPNDPRNTQWQIEAFED